MEQKLNIGSGEEETCNPERVATFENVSTAIEKEGLRFHTREHDHGENGHRKIYHSSEHPKKMLKRAEKMAEALNISKEQLALAKMAIAWHDTVIEYDEPNPNDLLSTIRRHRGAREGDVPSGMEGNENKSARLLVRKIREENKRVGTEIFSEEQIKLVSWAIDATYTSVELGPDFQGALFAEYPYYKVAIEQNPSLGRLLEELKKGGITKGPLFSQPHLEKTLEKEEGVPHEVIITALADLGAAGIAEKEELFKEGDAEMCELYENLGRPETTKFLTEGDKPENISSREKVTEVLLNWADNQIGFVVWQSLRFEKIISLLRKQKGVSQKEEENLRIYFSHYENNIIATRDRANELKTQVGQISASNGEKIAFIYLARSMHLVK